MRPSIDTVTAKILLAPVKYDFKRAAARCVCVTRGGGREGEGVAFTKFCGRFVNGFERLFNREMDGWDLFCLRLGNCY